AKWADSTVTASAATSPPMMSKFFRMAASSLASSVADVDPHRHVAEVITHVDVQFARGVYLSVIHLIEPEPALANLILEPLAAQMELPKIGIDDVTVGDQLHRDAAGCYLKAQVLRRDVAVLSLL